jgi:uncharacterized protein DUF4157
MPGPSRAFAGRDGEHLLGAGQQHARTPAPTAKAARAGQTGAGFDLSRIPLLPSAQPGPGPGSPTGSGIVFAENHYQPGSHAGRPLLAHELTNVLQQRSAGATAASLAHLGELITLVSGPPRKRER